MYFLESQNTGHCIPVGIMQIIISYKQLSHICVILLKKKKILSQSHFPNQKCIRDPEHCKKSAPNFEYWPEMTNSHWTFCFFLQGWMNEIQDYDPETYHPALTHSVFATLEGSCLRLDYPRTNIGRRATYDEKVLDACFVKSHCFQLAKSKVRWEWGPSNCFQWIYALHETLCLNFR